jgi:hypothetical protein
VNLEREVVCEKPLQRSFCVNHRDVRKQKKQVNELWENNTETSSNSRRNRFKKTLKLIVRVNTNFHFPFALLE